MGGGGKLLLDDGKLLLDGGKLLLDGVVKREEAPCCCEMPGADDGGKLYGEAPAAGNAAGGVRLLPPADG